MRSQKALLFDFQRAGNRLHVAPVNHAIIWKNGIHQAGRSIMAKAAGVLPEIQRYSASNKRSRGMLSVWSREPRVFSGPTGAGRDLAQSFAVEIVGKAEIVILCTQ